MASTRRLALGVVPLLLAVGACADPGDNDSDSPVTSEELVTSTEPGTQPVDEITWALYRDPISIDPITAGDYPELTVTSLMCESLFRQEPDGSVAPGLATGIEYSDETTAVITIRDDVTFSDGSPMTVDDVVFSLERNIDPELGGYWLPALSRIEKVEATGATTVTVTLSEPDYWLENALSFMAGVVVKKDFVEAAGEDYGTAAGGAMCTGAYEFDEWNVGDSLVVKANDNYYESDVDPLVERIRFKGIPDEATLTSALQTGEVDGSYLELPLSTLDQVVNGNEVTIRRGPSYLVDAFIVSDVDRGVLKDVRVRQALSLAFDRESYIDALYKGTAQPAKALGSPGTWGYARDQFEAAWEELPEPTGDLEDAKALIREAGVEGETITLGMSNEINKLATEANVMKTAAEKIGLKVELKSYSADAYGSLFLDAQVRTEVDGFFTTNFPTWADPGRLYAALGVPGAEQDYGGYDNPEVADLLEQARGTADPEERAALVIDAQTILTEELPWIPIVAPDTVLALNKSLSGATVSTNHFFSPWAVQLGGVD